MEDESMTEEQGLTIAEAAALARQKRRHDFIAAVQAGADAEQLAAMPFAVADLEAADDAHAAHLHALDQLREIEQIAAEDAGLLPETPPIAVRRAVEAGAARDELDRRTNELELARRRLDVIDRDRRYCLSRGFDGDAAEVKRLEAEVESAKKAVRAAQRAFDAAKRAVANAQP
jgi:hypothetical protein